MKLWKKLQNPFVLVGQGFALGAALFFVTQHDSGVAAAASPIQAASAQDAR